MSTSSVNWKDVPSGATRGTFLAPSGPLATFEAGCPGDPPVCLIPGITGSKEDFSLVIPHLARAGYRVIAVDLAGQYESSSAGPHSGAGWTLPMHVADIRAVLEYLGKAHVVGYSYGGLVCEHLIADEPALLRSATLIGTPPLSGNALRGFRVVGPIVKWASPAVAARVMLSGLRFNINRVDKERHAFVLHRMGYTVKESVTSAMADMLAIPDLEDALRHSGVPLLVGAGHGDMWPLEQFAAFSQRIGAEFREYNAGHSPSEQSPDELAADLMEFFDRVDRPLSTFASL
ncbi:alpha/beta hydrolase [Actinomycetaceae bacterium WB03_NA08]|uniref:Alpha/beta hydrolase n=1 Tax=Scrofimicrobium canadense TaxID=2652290 RepID=A0A6N7W5P2_9ACTO|nr:alpha/beta fold hydrolase [Scrofimicrobium canadense]MSS83536.1 alpha/beta hydrolase [Scrofimicrobium canadense]